MPRVGSLDLSRTGVGPAAHAGFDVKIAKHGFASLDVTSVELRFHVKLDGSRISTVRIDAFLLAVGIGHRF